MHPKNTRCNRQIAMTDGLPGLISRSIGSSHLDHISSRCHLCRMPSRCTGTPEGNIAKHHACIRRHAQARTGHSRIHQRNIGVRGAGAPVETTDTAPPRPYISRPIATVANTDRSMCRFRGVRANLFTWRPGKCVTSISKVGFGANDPTGSGADQLDGLCADHGRCLTISTRQTGGQLSGG
jgi:hypothetical protein